MIKYWITSYLPSQEELENLCLIALGQYNDESWSLIHVTLNWSQKWILFRGFILVCDKKFKVHCKQTNTIF